VAFGITLATSFSYLMSWGPYAADYSRYNKEKNAFIYTFLGGFIASLWAELAGVFIAILSFNPSANPAIDLESVLGPYGIVGLFAIFLGGIAADAINLYSNSVSLKTTGIKMNRLNTVIIGIVVAIILAIITYSKFYAFYEDFLFILDYWITPWIGIMIADFFIINKHQKFDTKKIPGFNKSGIFSYFIALLISIPFMDPGVIYEGIISKLYLGGVDISYYVSFIIALLLYPLIKKIINKRDITNNVK
jgi:NCS1 family nucleobase:cation symporter-1